MCFFFFLSHSLLFGYAFFQCNRRWVKFSPLLLHRNGNKKYNFSSHVNSKKMHFIKYLYQKNRTCSQYPFPKIIRNPLFTLFSAFHIYIKENAFHLFPKKWSSCQYTLTKMLRNPFFYFILDICQHFKENSFHRSWYPASESGFRCFQVGVVVVIFRSVLGTIMVHVGILGFQVDKVENENPMRGMPFTEMFKNKHFFWCHM